MIRFFTYMCMLSLFLSTGCQFDSMFRQSDATEIVWHLRYQNYDTDPPHIEWHTQGDLRCAPNGLGQDLGFYVGRYWGDPEHTDTCVLGVMWMEIDVAEIAWPDGMNYSSTAFAHELYHMHLYNLTGGGDPDHTDAGWGLDYGFPFGIVDQANVDLRVYGF